MSTASASLPIHSRLGLQVALWIAQLVLFPAFAMAGVSKLNPGATGFDPLPLALVRFIGTSELVGALAVLAGPLARRPRLSALAASGLVVVMTLAAGFHLGRGEFNMLPANFVLAALAAFVAWGRWTPSGSR